MKYKKCLNCNADFIVYPYNEESKKFCSRKCNGLFYAAQYSRDRIGKGNPMFGKTPWNFNGGGQRAFDYKYKVWRDSVIKRDKNICRGCGKTLEYSECVVHHPLPYDKFPSERFKKSNGITLCRSCHNKIDEGIKSSQYK